MSSNLTNGLPRQVIQIPLRGSSETLDLSVGDIEQYPPQEIIQILDREHGALIYWLQIAMVYYSVGQEENFVKMLSASLDPSYEQRYLQQVDTRIKIYNCLANHYIAINDLRKAENLLSTVHSLNMMHPLTNTSRGILELNKTLKPNLPRALNLFESALQNVEDLTPALLGRACVLYQQKKYADALDAYQQILRRDKDAPPSARLGIGLCFHRLGNDTKAKLAFERVLQLEPTNVDAHVAIAVIHLNDATAHEDAHQRALLVKKAMETLGAAYKLQNTHPMILTHLARHYFFRHQYSNVEKLASNAYHRTHQNSIKALASYQIAKSKHAQGLFDEAFKLYNDIVHIDPDFILGRFGLAQLLIYRGELKQAIPHFEYLCNKEPNSFEAHRILGHLFLHTHSRQKALKHLQKSYDIRPSDPEMIVELAQVHTNPEESLRLMKEAAALIDESDSLQQDFFFLTDYGNIFYRVQQFEEAQKYYQKALDMESITTTGHQKKHVFLVYNLARNYEAWGGEEHIQKAKDIYFSLVKQHPTFLASYLRLGTMFMREGNSDAALKWISMAAEVDSKNPLPFVVLGFLHVSRREWSHAQKQFEHIITNLDKNHSYANLALGHIFYSSARDHKGEAGKQDRYMKYGAQFFEKSLRADESNAFAAVSMGAYIAEQGYITTAKELFLKIRESTADIPEIWINLAHVEMCQGNYINAASMYEKCLQKIYQGNSVPVLELLAYSYYKDNKLDECMKTLEKAKEIDPKNLYVQYNIAIAHYTKANELMAEKKKSLDHALQASEEVLSCRVIFSKLASDTDNAYISDKAQQFYDHTASTLDNARRNEEKARSEQEKAEEMKKRQQEVIQQVQERRQAKKREEEERLARKQEEMKKQQEKLHAIMEKQVANFEQQREKALRRQSRQNADQYEEQYEDQEVYEEVVEPSEAAPSKKSKKGNSKKKKRLSRKGKSKKQKEEEDEEEEITFDDAPKESSSEEKSSAKNANGRRAGDDSDEEEITFDEDEATREFAKEQGQEESEEEIQFNDDADGEEEIKFDSDDDTTKKRSSPDAGHSEADEPSQKKQRLED